MEGNSTTIDKIKFYLAEFLMAFLGVLFAFWINDWGERRRDGEFVDNLFQNLVQDVRSDSIEVALAIKFVSNQRDSLNSLIVNLDEMNFRAANRLIYWTYFSYNAFNPTMETFESIFGGDMKLLNDFEKVKSIKRLFHANAKLKQVHNIYFEGIENFRNGFVCPYNLNEFDFESIPNKKEFWNRINFLKEDIELYLQMLVMVQDNYNDFLSRTRVNH